MQPRIDFDVVHTPEVVLVRVYYRNQLNVLMAHSEIKLSSGSDFPGLYDSFRREIKWPSSEEVETVLLPRYQGKSALRSKYSEAERAELAGRDLAEFFSVWLVIRGKGEVLSKVSVPPQSV